ncbi:putative thiamine transporter SLC35F3 isoform X3 [Paramacrobiotus metropolitanus]|nr:putative thiamine transporter SLC35F3 isoform X3 [Paramacrobiotus metropolitanus]XP_055341241.1 putative thiamine transporter SLC35F3 isoform X3 [Paramacrobiotus metropolitanus]XP_055341242.1 putative thiamine transporter SLC35F3 isoform X3 [Paramacrobiotus metropolitanus]
MLLIVVTLITLSSQLSNIAFTDPDLKFHAPFLFLLIKMSFRIFTFPVYLLISSITRKLRGREADVKENIRHCADIYGPGGFTWKQFGTCMVPSAVTVLATQIGWILGLAHLSTSVATAIICSAVAFAYLFTTCCMAQACLVTKSLFVAMAFGGVCLIVYGNFANGINAFIIIGIVAVLAAALFDALHLIAFKKAFSELDLGQTSYVVTNMYIFNCLVIWPVPIVLSYFNVEKFNSHNMPYGLLFGAWIASSVSSIAAGYGLVLSNPFFMSISELLILATNTTIDVTFRGVRLHAAQIAGSVMTAISFLVLILPDEYMSLEFWLKSKKKKDKAVNKPEEVVSVERKVLKPSESPSALNVHGMEKMATAE